VNDPSLQKLTIKPLFDNKFRPNVNKFLDQTKKLNKLLQEQKQIMTDTYKAHKTLSQSMNTKKTKLDNKITSKEKPAAEPVQRAQPNRRTMDENVQLLSNFMGITSSVMRLPMEGMREAVNTIIEVDSQMVQLKMAMGSFSDVDNMLKKSVDLADTLGRSISDVNETMIGFARMGYSEDAVAALSHSALLAQNISNLSVDETIDSLTTNMSNFNITAEESIRIIDSLNEVNKTASLCSDA